MRVGVQGHGYGSVPQKLLNELWVGALRKQQGSAGVPEVVEADVRQPGTLEQRLEAAITEIRGVDEGLIEMTSNPRW